MIHTDRHPIKRGRLAAVLLAAAAGVAVFGGCRPSGGNENGFSLENAPAQIAAATQHAHHCDDRAPVPTPQAVPPPRVELFEERGNSLSYEEFIQEQVDLFDELANTACGISSDGNENADGNPNGNDNQNDNG